MFCFPTSNGLFMLKRTCPSGQPTATVEVAGPGVRETAQPKECVDPSRRKELQLVLAATLEERGQRSAGEREGKGRYTIKGVRGSFPLLCLSD